MSDTGSLNPSPTGITPGISEDRLKKGVIVASHHSTTAPRDVAAGDFVVRIPRTQKQVAVRLNTRVIAEQREIERANEAIRKSGR